MSDQKTNRKKIPSDVEAEVIFQSNRLCCVDQKRGDHIHHIDGNNSNNEFRNLALLCFDCHNEATITGSLRKKLTPKAIMKFRDHHYSVILNNRNHALKKLNHSIKNLTSEDLISAATTALILMEITNVKDEYYNCVKMDRDYIINKLDKLSNHNNARISYEVFSFLTKVAYETRGGMSAKIAGTIFSLVMKFFPPTDILKNKKQLCEIGSQCIYIASTLVYDSTIHIKNFQITSWGLLILKFIYKQSKKIKVSELNSKVFKAYEELEDHLIRPERNDLTDAKRLINIFKLDLENPSLTYPEIPEDLYRQIELHKKS